MALRSLASHRRLVHGFSTVAMGSMGLSHAPDPVPVLNSRSDFARLLGIDPTAITAVGAVHGSAVGRVDSAREVVPDVDALVTDTPGVGLLATFADCYPLLAYDPANHAIGLAHAGWRGSAGGIAEGLVESLRSNFGSRAETLQIGIGPGICGNCYEVGPEFADRFPEAVLRRGSDDRLLLDLAEANRLQFVAAGVDPARIELVAACTLESESLFSHRRRPDGARFAALVALR